MSRLLENRLLFYTTENTLVARSELNQRPTSGTTYSLVLVAHALASRGFEVSIAGPLTHTFEEEGVTYLPCSGEDSLMNCLDHARSETLIIVGHAVETMKRPAPDSVRTLLWMHNWTGPDQVLEQIVRLRVKTVLTVSRYHLAYYLVRAFRHPSLWRHMRAIPNPLDTSHFETKRTALPPDEPELRVAFVGRPSKGKGFDKVCQVMAALQQLSSARCVLHVFGDPGLYGTSHQADTDLNAYSPCVHHGNLSRTELYPKLTECHFALSGLSGSETFCLSLLEAAACGVVPATLNSGGQVSFLNRSNALVADSLESLPAMLADTAGNPELYQRLARNAGNLPETFLPERVADLWIRALNRRPPVPGHFRITLWFLTSRLLRFFRTRFQ